MTVPTQSGRPTPQIIPRSEHNISRAHISKSALKVLYRLKDAGYQAFLVGGSVRDLLLEREPKDFDVATNALPEEVRALFGNCRLIGRRFRLAHVRFGREVIEVATFRGLGTEEEDSEGREVSAETGRLLRDNVYGGIEEDVWRRDFTANSLYYNIADFSIWDFTGGVADVQARRLRIIGEPEARFREDPVRMLRAARFAAKLDFEIDAGMAALIPGLAHLLDGVPTARLFDEFQKLFQGGHALEGYRQLRRHGLFRQLFPATAEWLGPGGDAREHFLEAALANTDARVADGRPVTPMFLLGVFLWGPVADRAAALAEGGMSDFQALALAAAELSRELAERIAVPKRFSIPMREMLQLQVRFDKTRGARALVFLQSERFRAAYDLLLLRAAAGNADKGLAEWWTRLQSLSPGEQRRELGLERAGEGKGSSRRRPGRRRPARSAPAAQGDQPLA
ncbi:MAG: polynucleotide adenylyltransferase PcnB [Gammaproteobacteria bacterium]|nr:polynucleotide adenylyltransferase PcnB [Gammaproteobacteria bacterium]